MDCKWNWRESYLCLSQIQTFPNLPHGERFPGKDFNGRGCLQKLDSGQVQGSKGVGKYDCIPGQCQQSTVQVIWSDIECSKSGFHHTKWSVWFHLAHTTFFWEDLQTFNFWTLVSWWSEVGCGIMWSWTEWRRMTVSGLLRYLWSQDRSPLPSSCHHRWPWVQLAPVTRWHLIVRCKLCTTNDWRNRFQGWETDKKSLWWTSLEGISNSQQSF